MSSTLSTKSELTYSVELRQTDMGWRWCLRADRRHVDDGFRLTRWGALYAARKARRGHERGLEVVEL